MNKIMTVGIALAMLISTPVTAKADNSEEVIIGILGGALGGLLVGGAIAKRDGYAHRHRYPVRREYYYEEGGYISHCRWIKRREFNPYINRYEYVRIKVCEE